MPTFDLGLQPLESGAREPLVWGAIGKAVGDGRVWEKLEDAALHRQLVEISVEEGEDALGQALGVGHGAGRGC